MYANEGYLFEKLLMWCNNQHSSTIIVVLNNVVKNLYLGEYKANSQLKLFNLSAYTVVLVFSCYNSIWGNSFGSI